MNEKKILSHEKNLSQVVSMSVRAICPRIFHAIPGDVSLVDCRVPSYFLAVFWRFFLWGMKCGMRSYDLNPFDPLTLSPWSHMTYAFSSSFSLDFRYFAIMYPLDKICSLFRGRRGKVRQFRGKCVLNTRTLARKHAHTHRRAHTHT